MRRKVGFILFFVLNFFHFVEIKIFFEFVRIFDFFELGENVCDCVCMEDFSFFCRFVFEVFLIFGWIFSDLWRLAIGLCGTKWRNGLAIHFRIQYV